MRVRNGTTMATALTSPLNEAFVLHRGLKYGDVYVNDYIEE